MEYTHVCHGATLAAAAAWPARLPDHRRDRRLGARPAAVCPGCHARYGPVWRTHLLRTLRFELLPEQDFSPVAVPTPMPRDALRVRVNVA